MESFESLITIAGCIPFVLALVQLFKGIIKDAKWYPFLAVGWGVVIAVGASYFILGLSSPVELATAFFNGLIAGLTAAGIYSGGTAITTK
jgi:hypothetical protein